MTETRVDLLTAFTAAALWPQLRRVSTEVVASRAGDHLLLRAGFAATGVGNLPLLPLPRAIVLGVRQAFTYQGVLVARQLAGGAAWEAVSLRLARDKDDDTVAALLDETANEVAARGGRTLFLRMPDGSPHAQPIQRSGLHPYCREQLFAPPAPGKADDSPMRPATRADRNAIFRLYCQSIPEGVRRHEAVTQQEFRAALDLYGCTSEYVLDDDGDIAAWAGFGVREAHVMTASAESPHAADALDLVRNRLTPSGTLVIGEHQPELQQLAIEHGFTPLGTRVLTARRLAALIPLKEALAVPATSRVPN